VSPVQTDRAGAEAVREHLSDNGEDCKDVMPASLNEAAAKGKPSIGHGIEFI
jgi:hypothetical protein